MVILTDQNFESEVLKSKEPVLVDFFAEWCGPCQITGPIIEELAKEYEGKVKIGKINVDENQQVAAKYGIMSIPTIIIFKNGQEIKREVGFVSKEGYAKLLDSLLSG
jgi:thioredoxin 1